jgi:DNA-binding NtrC family response regulator
MATERRRPRPPEPTAVADDTRRTLEMRAAWDAVSAAFGALGRAFICADSSFRILHGSYVLDEIFAPGAAQAIEGRPLEELFGRALFGASGTLREALLAGERREGWRAEINIGVGEARLVALSTAPFPQTLQTACDLGVRYIVVLRPAEQSDITLGSPVTLGGMVARSATMQRVFGLIENLKHHDVTVLITGESGTGKELVARAIHQHSPRHAGPFVAVNCGALPVDLLESEMFGHTRGAFTGAVRDRIGRFESASDGTLFLDEVGDLPLPVQVKLLRVLQGGTFERLGENQTRTSRARVVAATHVDLARAVREGKFRDDLYYRLRVVPIEIPPLRARPEDIEPIASLLLARVGSRHGRSIRISPEALRTLLEYDWPGNVRELENVLEYAVTVCRGQTVLPEDLPALTAAAGSVAEPPPGAPMNAPSSVAAGNGDDRETLRRLLDAHHWRRADTARALGISRITLWRRMRGAGLGD